MRKLTVFALAGVTWLAGCRAAAPVQPAELAAPAGENITVETLPSGLTVIVKPTRTAPVVAVRAYVRAGGLYEREWLGCGLSHLLEHLVADDAMHDSQSGGEAMKPTTPGENRVTTIGGQANAYTSLSHTCYYISAAAGRGDECIDLVADWLVRPRFTREDFEREHGVVQRELEKGNDEPERQWWYAQAANVFGTHPAAVPVIGYADPLSRVTWDDVTRYHRRMYVPQNMVLAVVGDVDAGAVLARARRAFAAFARGRVPDLSLPAVRPFTGIRRASRTRKDLKEALVSLSFQSIPLLHEDLYALDVLAYVLAEGKSSRLYQSVFRERKLVTRISSSSWTPEWGRGIFTISYRSDPAKADAAERAILAELRTVAAKGVTAEELARAKRQKIADWVHSQQTAESVAATLATDYLTTGDVLFSKHYTGRIQAVTAEEILAAARKYLTFDKMAITRLVPEAAGATTAPAAGARQHAARVVALPNGTRVILQPADAGLVSMVYVVKGGLLAESAKTNGLGALMTALSTRGTRSYTAKQIDEFFDDAGGGIAGNCGNNSFYWQATVLKDRFDKALDIFAEVLTAPAFPRKEMEILRPAALAAIRQIDETWYGQLSRFFRRQFFTDSPYGMLTVGREQVVAGATVADLRDFHRRHVAAGAGVLAVYGEFDADAAAKRIEKLLGAPRAPEAAPLADAEARKVAAGGERYVLKTDKKQAAVIVAAPGMRLTNLADRFPITVLDTIISGYNLPAGWLHDELRGKQLVYVVHAYNLAGLAPGAFITYAACQPAKAREVVEIITKNLRKAAGYKPTQKEIDLAVNTILTADLLENQSMSDLAMDAALNELYGLGHDFRQQLEKRYRSVTPEDVLRVGKKYLSGGYVVVVTTPEPETMEAKK